MYSLKYIVGKYRNKEIEYEAVKLLISHVVAVSGRRGFEVKIYLDNKSSRRLFEKLGTVVIGQECSKFIKAMKVLEDIADRKKDLFAGTVCRSA